MLPEGYVSILIKFYDVIQIILFFAFFISVFIGFRYLFSLIPERRKRMVTHLFRNPRMYQQWGRRCMTLLVPEKVSAMDEELSLLLREAGIPLSVLQYRSIQRVVYLVILLVLVLQTLQETKINPNLTFWGSFNYIGWVLLTLGLFLADKYVLEMMKNFRRERVTTEIHYISKRLRFYLAGKNNLHFALQQILPETKTLRKPFNTLVLEWHHDGEESIQQFGRRVGTKEGEDFANTLNTLRLGIMESSLVMLKERAEAYKVQSRLQKATKKQGNTLIFYLFMLGPFILTLFWFMYAWILEANESLMKI